MEKRYTQRIGLLGLFWHKHADEQGRGYKQKKPRPLPFNGGPLPDEVGNPVSHAPLSRVFESNCLVPDEVLEHRPLVRVDRAAQRGLLLRVPIVVPRYVHLA